MDGKPLLKDKDKPKKQKKKTVLKLKKELDKVFSLFIRHKYAKNGYVECYTCYEKKEINSIQNGHFVSRAHLATRYMEENCRPQCVGCNVFGGGRTAIYANRLETENPGIVAKLYRQAQEIVKNYPYEEKIEYYKEKLVELQ